MGLETFENEVEKVKRAPGKRIALLIAFAVVALLVIFAKGFVEEKAKVAANPPVAPEKIMRPAEPVRSQPTGSPTTKAAAPAGAILLIDSDQRDTVIDDMDAHLPDALYPTKKPEPQMDDWVKQAGLLGMGKPSVIVIHLHSLRPEFKKLPMEQRYLPSETKLLDGLGYLHANSRRTHFILWSQSVNSDGSQLASTKLRLALNAILREAPSRRAELEAVLNQSVLLYWPDKPGDTDYRRLRSKISEMMAAGR